MWRGAACSPATRCGCGRRRGTTRRRLTWGGARRSRCGCRASRSCGRRCAPRQALQRLAEAQQQLKAELERSRELFRRAATEGALASLAADAEDLKRRQAEWNGTDARRPDSAAAARERALAERADSLAHGIEQVGKDLGPKLGSETLAAPQQAAHRAQAAMQRATESAGRSDAAGAQQAGEEAEQQLAELPDALRARRDSLAGAWRRETLDALDRALAETAALAEREHA